MSRQVKKLKLTYKQLDLIMSAVNDKKFIYLLWYEDLLDLKDFVMYLKLNDCRLN